MPDFAQLPARPFLYRFALYTGSHPYRYFAEFLNSLGYRVTTRKRPSGRLVSADDVRRFVRKHFSASTRWPASRPATQDDYDRIKIDILAEYDGEDSLV